MVRYWEEFGTIAFDPSHDTLLTACELKSPIDEGKSKTKSKEIKCCFSLKIRRDDASDDLPARFGVERLVRSRSPVREEAFLLFRWTAAAFGVFGRLGGFYRAEGRPMW